MKVFFTCLFVFCICYYALSHCVTGKNNGNDNELLAIEDSIALKVNAWTKLAEAGKFKELTAARQDLECFVAVNLPRVQRFNEKELQQQLLHHLQFLQKRIPETLVPFERLTNYSDNKEISRLADKINGFSKEEERIGVKMDQIRKKLKR